MIVPVSVGFVVAIEVNGDGYCPCCRLTPPSHPRIEIVYILGDALVPGVLNKVKNEGVTVRKRKTVVEILNVVVVVD